MVLLEFADGSKRMTQKALYEAADSLGAFDNMTSGDDFADWHLNTWAGGVVSDPQYKAAHKQFNTSQISYNNALMEANPEIAQNRLAFVQRYAPNNQAAIDAAQSLVDQYSGGRTLTPFTPDPATQITPFGPNVNNFTGAPANGGIASLVPEAPETDPNASNQTYGANPSDFVIGGLSSFYRPPTEQYTAPTTFGDPINTGQIFAQDVSLNPFRRPT